MSERSSPPELTLLFLPGLSCDGAVWRAQQEALADRARCIVVDYGLADSLSGMAEVALAAAPGEFAVAGHSMGGRVALEIVRLAGERVRGVALLDTGYLPLPRDETGEAERRQRLQLLDLARSQGMRAMGRVWLQGMVHPARLRDAELIETILAMFDRRTPEIFAAQIKALLDRPDAEPVLRSLRCPTLVLCGREDSWSPVDRHAAMAALVAQATLEVIEQCGHMATLEQPEAVSAALGAWIARLGAIRAG